MSNPFIRSDEANVRSPHFLNHILPTCIMGNKTLFIDKCLHSRRPFHGPGINIKHIPTLVRGRMTFPRRPQNSDEQSLLGMHAHTLPPLLSVPKFLPDASCQLPSSHQMTAPRPSICGSSRYRYAGCGKLKPASAKFASQSHPNLSSMFPYEVDILVENPFRFRR